MEELIYEEDLYPAEDIAPTPKEMVDDSQKPSYTNPKKRKKKKDVVKKTFKERLRDDVFIRRAGTTIAVMVALIWALVSAFNSIGNNLINNFIRGLGFENVAQFEMVMNEFNTPYTPNIETSIESMPDDNLFKILNEEFGSEPLNNDVNAQFLGWDENAKLVFKLDITKIKSQAKSFGFTLPTSIYVSFVFDWGYSQIEDVWFNNISSESNALLINALGGDELKKAIAASLNTWFQDQNNA